MTEFSFDGKLYRYKRLSMELHLAQGELNASMQQIFPHIPNAHVIHDDLTIATKTFAEHISVIK